MRVRAPSPRHQVKDASTVSADTAHSSGRPAHSSHSRCSTRCRAMTCSLSPRSPLSHTGSWRDRLIRRNSVGSMSSMGSVPGQSHAINPSRRSTSVKDTTRTVSYTHLRAHETDSYLVCRLLLEKKKKKTYKKKKKKNKNN